MQTEEETASKPVFGGSLFFSTFFKGFFGFSAFFRPFSKEKLILQSKKQSTIISNSGQEPVCPLDSILTGKKSQLR